MNQQSQRTVFGLHPALVVGIVMLILSGVLAIVLVFTGTIAEQGARVFWTVLTCAVFTALLALDLTLSRTNPRPLIIGTVANCYMLIVSMLTIWMNSHEPRQIDDYTYYYSSFELIYQVPAIMLVTRAAWGLCWAVLTFGERIRLAIGKVFGYVTAGLVGLAGVLLTVHFPLVRLGIEIPTWYWRTLVAVTILAAISSCILLLLYWNQNSMDRASRPKMPQPYPGQQVGHTPNPMQQQPYQYPPQQFPNQPPPQP